MSASLSARVDLASLKRDHPLSEVIAASGIALRPIGKDRFSARCPFHEDHEPSLLIDERDGHFHCFGCQAHGDVVDFLMRHQGITFAETCRRLAQTPAQPRPKPLAQLGVTERRWDRLTLEQQVVMNTAGAIYQHGLWREPKALAYARSRGLPDWLIRRCALGYPDGHSLEAYLRRGNLLRVAVDLGLLRRDPKRLHREFLAERLVIPELRAGQVVWFIGRRLDDDGGMGPKYLALPGERPILGHERAAGQREAFLCEGVFDWLTALAWNLPAFSPCGTNVPPERLGFLARAHVVYGVFDGDAAGRSAAQSFGDILGSRWHPLTLPEDCDLNDLGRRPNGHRIFCQLLSTARDQQHTENSSGA